MSESNKPDKQAVLRQLRQERAELTILCNELTPQEWETQSLCEDWKVRDVVAHIIGGQADILTYFTGTPQQVSHKIVAKYRRFSTASLVTALANINEPANLTRLFPVVMLHDNWVHQQDIRWVLGPQRQRPQNPHRTRMLLDLLQKSADGKKRGVLYRATDTDWQAGEAGGQEITGQAEDLIMLLTHRPAALKRVSGPGVAVLAERWKLS